MHDLTNGLQMGQGPAKHRCLPALCALVLGSVFGATFAPSAQAGEFLRFKQETVRTSSFASMPDWLQQSVNGPEAAHARYFVVQFKARISASDRAALQAAGAQPMRYVPDDALIVRASSSVAQRLATGNAVRTVLPYGVRWRISSELRPSVFVARDQARLLIRAFDESETAGIAAQIAALPGADVESADGKSIVVSAPMSQLTKAAEIEGVEWTQELPIMTTMEARLLDSLANTRGAAADGDYSDLDGYESGTKAMKFDAAWNRSLAGSGQIGAMADTGLDSGDVATLFSGFRGRVPAGRAFGLFATSWADPMGHGTHVAGSVMAGGAINGGKIQGGAHAAQLVAQGLWSPMLGGLGVPPKLSDLFSNAEENGARVHTNSWGSPRNLGAYDGFSQQVDEYMFQHQDFLVLFAAGNSGADKDRDGRIDSGSVSSPGTAKNCLTVGASKNLVSRGGIQKKMSELRGGQDNWGVEPIASSKLSDNLDGLAAFSSRGPTNDGRIKPDVVAPGTNILSNRSHERDAEALWGIYNDHYVWSGGTSMATPLVAGAALVARQYLMEKKGIASPSAALVKAALIHTAHDIFPGGFGAVGKERGQEILSKRPTTDAGYGRVDMDRATAMEGVQLYDEKAGVALGEAKVYKLTATQAGQMTATLTWTDAPGASAAAKALVNDLDLVVVDSSGRETSMRDATNNVEMVEIPVAAGEYEVRVKGTNVPQGISGKQPFALIVSVP